MISKKFYLIMLVGLTLCFISCEKDKPEIPNEEELITTLVYTLSEVNGGAPVTLRFTDLDGDGGETPVFTVENLKANTEYSGILDLLNEQETPAESISGEVAEEAEEHQFFFQSNSTSLSVSYDDADADDNPIGLKTKLTTTEAGSALLTITLRHEPNKSASGVKEGRIENAGGETDIEVQFNVTIL